MKKKNHNITGCHAYKIEMFYFQAHLCYLYIAKWTSFQTACFWMDKHRRKIVLRQKDCFVLLRNALIGLV